MPRILLAEDDDVVRDMPEALLERDGFEVVDVLLSDLHMPHLVMVSPLSAPCATPARGSNAGAQRVPRAGRSLIRLQADKVLVKPIEIASLREIIHKEIANPHPTGRCPRKARHPYWSMISARSVLDVFSIASEVDSQLKPAMLSCAEPGSRSAWPAA